MSGTAAVPAYEEHRPAVLKVMARRCPWLDSGDREALFHDAYTVLLDKQRQGQLEAMSPQQVRAYLIQTALYKALDEAKRAGRRRSTPLSEDALATPDPGRTPDEIAAASFDSERVREIIAELPTRRQTIIKLRFYFDRTPAEIQRLLGVTERTYRKELERALKQIAQAYQLVREDRFCDSRRSLIMAYVAGIAGPNRAIEARRHLASCPACASWAADLRTSTERVAALLPTPVISVKSLHGPIGDRVAAAHEVIERIVDGTRQYATSSWATHVEAATTHYAAAVRPGAVAAVVAGCLAVGGGATYCVTAGLPFTSPKHHAVRNAEHRAPARPAARPRDRARATTPARAPLPTSAPKRHTTPKTTAHKTGKRTSHRSTSSPQVTSPSVRRSVATAPPRDEFGFERKPPAPTASSARSPAPTSPGEFDP